MVALSIWIGLDCVVSAFDIHDASIARSLGVAPSLNEICRPNSTARLKSDSVTCLWKAGSRVVAGILAAEVPAVGDVERGLSRGPGDDCSLRPPCLGDGRPPHRAWERDRHSAFRKAWRAPPRSVAEFQLSALSSTSAHRT